MHFGVLRLRLSLSSNGTPTSAYMMHATDFVLVPTAYATLHCIATLFSESDNFSLTFKNQFSVFETNNLKKKEDLASDFIGRLLRT